MASMVRIVGAARVVAGLTMVSRITGLAREMLYSRYFGTSELLSAFRIAFLVPNLSRRLFGEGALSSSVIPVLADTLRKDGELASRRFIGALTASLTVVLGAVVIAGEVVLLIWTRASDDPSLRLTAITLPYMVMVCIAAVGGAVLNTRDRFAVPAAIPILLNLVLIAGVVFASVRKIESARLVEWLCWTVLVAGLAQVAATALALWRARFWPVFGALFRHPQVREVCRMMGPMVLGLSAVQINSLVDYVVAYLFIDVEGERVGPAVLGYAQQLYQLPLGVFGIGLATTIFPTLAKRAAEGDFSALGQVFAHGLRVNLFMGLPAAVGLIFAAHPLVATFFEGGEFGARETHRVAGTLICYGLGMAAYFAQHVIVRTFYALRDSRTPARAAGWMVAANLGLNLILVRFLQEKGLALSTALCATVQSSWLVLRLRRLLPNIGWHFVLIGFGKSAAASAVMGVWLFVLDKYQAFGLIPWGSNAVRLTVLVVSGLVMFGISARLLNIEELSLVLRRGLPGQATAGDKDIVQAEAPGI